LWLYREAIERDVLWSGIWMGGRQKCDVIQIPRVSQEVGVSRWLDTGPVAVVDAWVRLD
jgi:hypothetical protein